MSAQYRPYRDEDSAADSEPMTWQEQEPGSIQIYEKTTEDIRVVSHRHLVVGGIGVALLGVLAGLLVGYFAHTQHTECVRGKSVAIHAVYDADPTVRSRLLPLTSADRINSTVREFLSPEGEREPKLVKIIHDSWLKHGLESVRIDTYNVLLSFPDESRPNNLTVTETDQGKVFFHSTLSTPDYRPYVAYAQSAETQGPVVYSNFLRNQDIDFLHYNNVTLNGSVLVARLGSFPVQHQIQNALLVGANALILYPDPAEYHPVPEGASSWWLPKDGIHTLSALADAFGDPQTPGYAATSTAYRPPEQDLHLPQIPIQTVSATIASVLLSNIRGPLAEKTMYGQFPGMAYHIGPGPAVAHLKVHNILQNHSVDDVVGFIRGKVEPDRYVIVGSARDSWSQSQVGGMAVLQELTAVFGQLLQEGWRPRRSILFCSWGAEGFNSVGSTEWLEEHMKLLHGRAVAYIDVSTPVLGTSSLSVSASPLLYHTIFNATKQVPEPNNESQSVYDKWISTFLIQRNLSRLLFPSNPINMATDMSDDMDDIPTFMLDPTPKGLLENYLHAAMLPQRPAVKPLEMRGGYASFFTRAGIPVVQMAYVDDLHVKMSHSVMYPRYRTQYDTFDFIQNEIDPSLKVHRAITQVVGELLRDLADSMFLPFNLLDYAQLLRDLYFSLHIHLESITQGHGIDLSVLDGAIQNFSAAAFAFHQRQNDMDTSDPMAIRRVNDQLLLLERAFLDPVGLPRNSFKKHIVLSPSESPSYLDEMFPGIMDEFMLLLQKAGRPDAPQLHIQVLQQHYLVLVETIQQAADSLAEVVPS